jgi:serine/threonine-protein kinase
MPKARAAAMRALEIDPLLPEAHVSLGIVKQTYEFDWPGAAREFGRALDLSPGNADARLWHGWALRLMGRSEEGIAEARSAHDLDPLSLFVETGLGQMYYLSGKVAMALRTLDGVVKVDSRFFPGHYYLGVANLCAQKFEDASRELEAANALSPGEPQPIAYLAYAQSKSGDRHRAAALLSRLREMQRTRYIAGYLFAVVYAGLGEPDRAIEALGRSYEDRDDMMMLLKGECAFADLGADPRYQNLERRMGI